MCANRHPKECKIDNKCKFLAQNKCALWETNELLDDNLKHCKEDIEANIDKKIRK